MKVVINVCFGGFGLSARGVQRLAELRGRSCYFFKRDIQKDGLSGPLIPITADEADKEFMFSAYDIPNPDEVIPKQDNWQEMSKDERTALNEVYEAHVLKEPDNRADPDLVRVVEELGADLRTGASGPYAKLAVVDIPDDVEYSIEEYDGLEHIAELHRTWP